MTTTRRSFLKVILLLAGGLIIGYTAVKRIFPIRNLYIKFVSPELKKAPVGTINQHVVKTLLAVTEHIIEYPIEEEHYKDYFRWRAENLKGYKNLYEQFTSSLDYTAKNLCNCDFIKCDKSKQHQIVKSIGPSGKFDKLKKRIFKETWLSAERYIFSEVLSLFAITDAWLVIGYKTWPGQPRGLYEYTQPPEFLKRTSNV